MIIKKDDPAVFDAVCNELRKGNAVIAPCDTIYGFLGIVPYAQQAIRMIKGRKETKPFLQLIQKPWIRDLSPMEIPRYLLDYWPGPLTLVVQNLEGSTTAYRAPDDKFLDALLRELSVPLYSTSVNHAGESPLNDISRIVEEFGDLVPLIVDAGDLGEPLASTIVDAASDPPRVLRQGICQVIFRDSR